MAAASGAASVSAGEVDADVLVISAVTAVEPIVPSELDALEISVADAEELLVAEGSDVAVPSVAAVSVVVVSVDVPAVDVVSTGVVDGACGPLLEETVLTFVAGGRFSTGVPVSANGLSYCELRSASNPPGGTLSSGGTSVASGSIAAPTASGEAEVSACLVGGACDSPLSTGSVGEAPTLSTTIGASSNGSRGSSRFVAERVSE